MIPVYRVIVLDDGVYLLRELGGPLEPLYAPGRPGGICAHSTAYARRSP